MILQTLRSCVSKSIGRKEKAGSFEKVSPKPLRVRRRQNPTGSRFQKEDFGSLCAFARCLHRWVFYNEAIRADYSRVVQGGMRGVTAHSSHLCSSARNKKLLSCFSNQSEVKLRSSQVRAGVSNHSGTKKKNVFGSKMQDNMNLGNNKHYALLK